MKNVNVALFILALTGALAAQEPSFQEKHQRYRIHIGDVIAFNFSFTPQFSHSLTVQPDGYITLRDVGDIQVLEKTTPEVIETVRTAYSRILHDPAVSIELKDFEKPYFVVGGEVTHPGKFDMRGDTTVMQAVTIAGG